MAFRGLVAVRGVQIVTQLTTENRRRGVGRSANENETEEAGDPDETERSAESRGGFF